jgi:hypothetical protein
MDLRPGSTFFLEQIRGGAAGAGCVWQEKVGVELFFWIWSCLELSQTQLNIDVPSQANRGNAKKLSTKKKTY